MGHFSNRTLSSRITLFSWGKNVWQPLCSLDLHQCDIFHKPLKSRTGLAWLMVSAEPLVSRLCCSKTDRRRGGELFTSGSHKERTASHRGQSQGWHSPEGPPQQLPATPPHFTAPRTSLQRTSLSVLHTAVNPSMAHPSARLGPSGPITSQKPQL